MFRIWKRTCCFVLLRKFPTGEIIYPLTLKCESSKTVCSGFVCFVKELGIVIPKALCKVGLLLVIRVVATVVGVITPVTY